MGRLTKILGAGAVLFLFAGCLAGKDQFEVRELPKGEQLNIRNILAAHPNKKACVDYQAATNSCTSIITSTVNGNALILSELTALRLPDTTAVQNVEVITRSTLEGDRACARGEDVSVVGSDTMSTFLLAATRDKIKQFGGAVCGTYYRSGDGYVVSSVGANGQPFPPGDTKIQFILGDLSLRAQ